MPKITLDKDHKYSVDGVEKPGVTKILEAAGLIDKTYYNDHACIRGQYVHKAILLYHTQGLNFNSLDGEIKPYFRAYLDFQRKSNFKLVLIEKSGYHPIYDYCGTPDLIGYINDPLSLIDIKTGSVPDWVAMQTAAYKMIFDKKVDNLPITKRYALNLTKEEKWSLIPLNNRHDEDIFKAALTLFNYKRSLI